MKPLAKIDWIHWILDEICKGTDVPEDDIRIAKDFIEDIEDYVRTL